MMNNLEKRTIYSNIIDHIKYHRSATYVNLTKNIVGFDGDISYENSEYNIVFWPWLSKEASNAIKEIVKQGLVRIEVVSPYIYYYDGYVPNMKVAKKICKYKERRWLPIVLIWQGG